MNKIKCRNCRVDISEKVKRIKKHYPKSWSKLGKNVLGLCNKCFSEDISKHAYVIFKLKVHDIIFEPRFRDGKMVGSYLWDDGYYGKFLFTEDFYSRMLLSGLSVEEIAMRTTLHLFSLKEETEGKLCFEAVNNLYKRTVLV